MRVVATAGHVDHGKSSLVRALTGTDPDRWAEERRRGLTIDLGFAFTTLPSGIEVGFVDVPGHVRFLKNMLAGVGAVDTALFVVDASEGWMPQSEEHLHILELLGMAYGFTALTKADLVDDETLDVARLEVTDRLDGSFLGGAPVVTCDAVSGRGLDDVRAALDEVVGHAAAPADRGRPRLWIDRVFAIRGAGTVVTGTLAGGSLAEGDELVVVPGNRRTRVRGIESAHRARDHVGPGARVALNLGGVEHGDVHRGHALVREGQWAQTSTVDVALTMLPGDPPPTRARLKAYVGSGEHDALVRRIGQGYARVFLATPLPLAPGDRLILRDPGPDRTVGGAEVLEVAPIMSGRDAPSRLGLPLGSRLLAARPWLEPGDLRRLGGLSDAEAAQLAADLVDSGAAVRAGGVLAARDALDHLVAEAEWVVDAHHREHPLDTGVDLLTLASRLAIEPERLRAVVESTGGLVLDGGRVRRPAHTVDVTGDPAARKLLDALLTSPFAPPSPRELGTPPEVVRALVRDGRLVDVEGMLMTPAALEAARVRLAAALEERGSLTVAEVRDLLGSSRRYVLPLLGFLDARGVTRRRGDTRVAGPRLHDPLA